MMSIQYTSTWRQQGSSSVMLVSPMHSLLRGVAGGRQGQGQQRIMVTWACGLAG